MLTEDRKKEQEETAREGAPTPSQAQVASHALCPWEQVLRLAPSAYEIVLYPEHDERRLRRARHAP